MAELRAFVLLALLAGCGEEAGTPAPSPPPDLPPRAGGGDGTPPREEGEAGCGLDDARLVASGVRARRGLAVAGGWYVALDDSLIAIGPDGARHEVAVTEPRRLLAAGLVDGRPLALYEASTADAAHALVAHDPVADAASAHPLPGALATSRRATSDDALWFAWSSGGARGLERFGRGGARVVHETLALGDAPATDEAPVEVLDLVVDGPRWAVVWRRGPTEDPRSHVYVSTPAGDRDSHGLHEALAIEASGFDGDALVLVAAFEFARPGVVRFAPEEEPLAILAPGTRAPPPLTDRVRAGLDADDDGLWLARRDALGQRLGQRSRLVEGAVEMAALERRGDGYAVAWTAADGLHEGTFRCPAE